MPATADPRIGASIDELDTPVLVLDLDVMEANIRRMAEKCRRAGVAWRPHSKAHKSPDIARRQLQAGALGVTCAKLGEAEVMAAGGVEDILIANQIAGPPKVRRLVQLAQSARPMVAVDDLAQAEPISAAAARAGVTVRVLIEVDIGMQRAGTGPGEPTLRLAQSLVRLPGIELAGIMGYEGHLLQIADSADKARQIRAAMATLVATRDLLLDHDIPCPIVSAGGTGSYMHTIECPGITELQAGGLIFMDNYYRTRCQVSEFDVALRLLVTVVSRPAADRAIIDAGRKTHIMDVAVPTVVGRDDIRVVRLSAEHGALELAPSARDLRVGDRLELVLGYSDFTTVLHNEFVGVRGGRVTEILPLLGRGQLQ